MPRLARAICRELLDQIAQLTTRIRALEKTIDTLAKEAETSRRLPTMPGVGPISALAVETFAPPLEPFKRGRDVAACLRLVPRQNASGGKRRLGKTSKMGQRDIRRLLIIGTMAVVRWALRPPESLAGAPAPDGRRLCAGEQDGAWHLGDAVAQRELSRSGHRKRRLIRQRRPKSDRRVVRKA